MMTVVDKQETIKLLVKALEADRDYWRSKAHKQKQALETVSEMLLGVDSISDEVLSCLENATRSDYDLTKSDL